MSSPFHPTYPTPADLIWQPTPVGKGHEPVIIMYGLGADGASYFEDILNHPHRREFDLQRAIVLTSQTGLEWPWTAYLNERYLYPRLRAEGMRTVQIAKAGPYKKDGYVVLSDTRSPRKCYIRGTYTLAHNSLEAGTLPQYQQGKRKCSDAFKGQGQDLSIEYYIPTLTHCPEWESDPDLDEGYEPDIETIRSYSLGEMLLHGGITPPYSKDIRTCSEFSKVGPALQWTEDEIRKLHQQRNAQQSWHLDHNLLANGALPQFSPDHVRKCSDQYKQVPCNQWTEDTLSGIKPTDTPEEVPTVYAVIGFHAGEVYRRDRGEFAQQKRDASRSKSKPPMVKRENLYPIIERGWDRSRTEWGGRQLTGDIEDWWRSSCCNCPFSAISGPSDEVLMKHRRFPKESGYAMYVERVAQLLNPKQTSYPDMRTIYDMIVADENWAAVAELERRLDQVPWALYHVRRNYNPKQPQRWTQIVAVGDRQSVYGVLQDVAQRYRDQHNVGHLTDMPDGFPRLYVEMRSQELVYELLDTACKKQSGERYKKNRKPIVEAQMKELLFDNHGEPIIRLGYNCEELFAPCPAVVLEKSMKSFERNWNEAHKQSVRQYVLPIG
jgi:hypothetical protein